MPSRRLNLRIAPTSVMSDMAGDHVLAGAADGERVLAQRGLPGLRDVVDAAGRDSGWSHFWRGYALQFDDLGLARAEWLLAEACFERDADASGLDLTACGFVQCALLDNLSYVGFDERAARIPPATPGAGEATPLALFRSAARLLLAVERREAMDAVADDIERAFAALGTRHRARDRAARRDGGASDARPRARSRARRRLLPGWRHRRRVAGALATTAAHCGICSSSTHASTMPRGPRSCAASLTRSTGSPHRMRCARCGRARTCLRAALALGDRRHRGGPREPRCGPSAASPVPSARLLDVPLLQLAPRPAYRRARRRLGTREGAPSQAARGVRARGRPHDDHDAGGLRARRARPPRRSRCRVCARGRAVARRAGDAMHRSRPSDARAAALARRRRTTRRAPS